MIPCKFDDERVCMASDSCSECGRRRIQIDQRKHSTGLRWKHGQAFYDAFDKAFNLKK